MCKEYENHRIHFREGNQTNNEFLSKLVNEVESFDIIFDDGSHYSSDIIHTFKYLFRSNALKSLGWYVIEDLQCSYPPYTNEPLNMRFNSQNQTSIEFLKYLIDEMNTKETIIKGINFYKKFKFCKQNRRIVFRGKCSLPSPDQREFSSIPENVSKHNSRTI